jgi:hypothetical protein
MPAIEVALTLRGQTDARVIARLDQAQRGAQERKEEQQAGTPGDAAHSGQQEGSRRDTDHQRDRPVEQTLSSPRRPDVPRDRRHARAPA